MYKSIKHFLYIIYSNLTKSSDFKVYRKGIEKPKIIIIFELFQWAIKEHSFCSMYYAFGLNIAGSRPSDFIGKKEFSRIRKKAEKSLQPVSRKKKIDYSIVTKDKFYATSILKANGVASIENLYLISYGKLIDQNGNAINLDSILQIDRELILKNTTLEASEGLSFLNSQKGELSINGEQTSIGELRNILKSGFWVIQKKIKPNQVIAKINDSALNTTRIVTINNGKEIEYLTGFQSFATNNNNSDGWDKGTIYVGIDINNSCLKSEGFYHPQVGQEGIVFKHPDSGIEFNGYKISMLKDAVALCKRAHQIFTPVFCIGWDVAMTDEGIKILEANEQPGLNAVQCIEGGLRKTLNNYQKSIISNRNG